MSKTDVRSFYDKKYIGSWDLPEGRDVNVIIDHCEGGKIVGMNGKTDKKPLLYFSNTKDREKPMVLGATNRNTIMRLYGKYIEDWVGKPITLYLARTLAGGEEVDCIRIRPDAPNLTASKLTAPVEVEP